MSNTQAQNSKALNQLQFGFDPKGRTLAHALLYPTLALGMTSVAQAAIVHGTGPVIGSDGASSAWNIDGTGAAEVTLTDNNGTTDAFSLSWSAQQAGFGLFAANSCELGVVNSPTIVDSSGLFTTNPCTPGSSVGSPPNFFGFSNWGFPLSGGSGTFGFKFDNSGTINYGIANFAFVNWDGSAPVGDFTITNWYYNDNGLGIKGDGTAIDAVPEPATAALMGLALGAIGLRRRRRNTTKLH